MTNFIKIWFQDSVRGFLALLIGLLVACPLCILFALIPVWEENRYRWGDGILIGAFALWMFIFLGGITAYIIIVMTRRKKWLDSVFTPLGLTGKPYMLNWREYTGTYRGRKICARFYRGPTVEINIETSLKTRFGIADQNQPGLYIASLANRKPISFTQQGLESLRVFALDENWTTRLLESEDAGAAVVRLIKAGDSWAVFRQVFLRPLSFQLHLYRNKNMYEYIFTADDVRQWTDDLITVAERAECLPEPEITAEESRLEIASRTGKITRNAIIFTIGFFFLCGGLFGLLMWLLVTYGG